MTEPIPEAVYGYDKKLWFRGPATIKNGVVTLDLESAEYNPDLGGDESVVVDLAAVQSEADVIDFVARWGLLFHGPGNEEFSERVEDWFAAADLVATTLKLAILLRSAKDDCGPLRDYFKSAGPLSLSSPEQGWADPDDFSDNAIIQAASMLVTTFVNRATKDGIAWSLIDAGLVKDSQYDPGTFVAVVGGQSLYSNVMLRLSTLLAKGSTSLRLCKGCGRPFQPDDGKQKYHSKKCGERARYRKWYRENKSVKND